MSITALRPMGTAELLVLASVAVDLLTEEHQGLSVRVSVLGGGHGRPFIELTLPDDAPVAARRGFLTDAGRAFGRRIEPVLDSAAVRVHDWEHLGIYLECRTRAEAVGGGR